jgi:uncharacterized protein
MQAQAQRRREANRSGSGTERLCVATAEVKPIDAMIRFVVGPDDAVVPDVKRRLPGRGIWVTSSQEALRKAIACKAFARGFKRNVRVGSDLIETTDQLLERAALESLSVAHKAGRVIIGFDEVSAAFTRDRIMALLHASEAAPDGCRRLAGTRAHRSGALAITVIDAFTSAQLGLALGRPSVIHAGLLAGLEGTTFMARTARLACFRTESKSAITGDGPDRQAGIEMSEGRQSRRRQHEGRP